MVLARTAIAEEVLATEKLILCPDVKGAELNLPAH
jgi:hypothetical protein